MTTAKQRFLDISVALTGFSEMELLGTGMLDEYYTTLVENTNPAVLEAFLAESDKILKANAGNANARDKAIGTKLLPPTAGKDDVSPYDGIASAIISMWYLGNWKGAPISPQAYVQGLIWGVAQSHPPGAKQPGYDSWSRLPIA